MFYNLQDTRQKKEYEELLGIIGSLSKLFSDAKEPYLYYRVAEKIFCQAFSSQDLSRGDVALDAFKGDIGIGLKTFLAGNYKSFQKIAEFNKDKTLYDNKAPIDLIRTVAMLRNRRVEFTENLYNIDYSLYHCVVRGEGVFKIHEELMNYVDIDNIHELKVNRSSISFTDGINDYSFNISKSTLSKRFLTQDPLHEFEVKVLKNPLSDIKNCLLQNDLIYTNLSRVVSTIYLPLYGKNRIVYERSGLNQWNASGRVRDINEVYIPIPSTVHKKSPKFFPPRDKPFNLKLPNGEILQSKVCQSGDKALMSYSNKDLGRWILRDVLKLKEEELLTYEKLQILGIDSVRIDKINNENYEINFVSLGSFERFING
jgi:hypothetical protein